MKFARRRTDEAPPPEAADAPAPPSPPPGRPVADLATILDGHLLWVGIGARPGAVTLRPAGAQGDALTLRNIAPDDQPGWLSTCLDLDTLPTTGLPASYDVVLAPPGPRKPVAVWSPPLAAVAPRTARDGRTVHALERVADGGLRVTTSRLPGAASIETVTVVPDGALVRLSGSGRHLAALDDAGEVVESWLVDDGVAALTLEPLLALTPQLLSVVTGEAGAWRPVRRRGNDLLTPGRSAPLPQLFAADGDQPRARLRWSQQATLQLRILKADAGAGEDE